MKTQQHTKRQQAMQRMAGVSAETPRSRDVAGPDLVIAHPEALWLRTGPSNGAH